MHYVTIEAGCSMLPSATQPLVLLEALQGLRHMPRRLQRSAQPGITKL